MRKIPLAVLSVLVVMLSWTATTATAAPIPAETSQGQAFVLTPDGEMKVMDASSCNYPQWGTVCVNVNGSGLFVSRITGSHPVAPYECGRAFHLWGYYENGEQWHRNATADCGYVRVWVDFDMNANMRDGSQICADMREGASQWHENGFACITVHR
ncbi:hypothetical protein [Kribbella sp. NPDC051620]|uniref:hypothetical protein n=1 Tax=Kribbella sp. NPDC051620 TaxID=3364120 RepID=UPI0037A44AF0